MKEIQLSQGKVALVDDADYEWLNQWKWYAERHRGYLFYAARNSPMVNSCPRTRIYMHWLVLGAKGGDHKDGNGLNNQRGNLRGCTHRQNSMNTRPQTGGASIYKGVVRERKSKIHPWRAQIMVQGKNAHLGCYATEGEAALVYNQKAAEIFGEFARLNVIGDYKQCLNL
uniref:Putative homing endonuclease n=1 Tax=viral metagenome TaxID=1070528 RepID=A0A6M3JCL7_9ZZZZ